jgi:hypothetical protein
MIINGKKYVVKSNRLINSFSKFSIDEYRIMNYVFSQINTYDIHKKRTFTIKIQDIIETYDMKGSKKSLYGKVKDSITNDLFNRVIKYEGEKEGEIISIHWLNKIIWNAKESRIDIELHEDILDDIYDLSKITGGFTKLDFDRLKDLNNYYSLKLYEILESRISKTKKNSINIGVEELFNILQLPESYDKCCNLNARLLIPSANKFKQSKNIDFSFRNEKIGHGKDSFIRFYINKKPTNKKPESKIKDSMSNIETTKPKNHLTNKRTQEEIDIARKGLEELKATL